MYRAFGAAAPSTVFAHYLKDTEGADVLSLYTKRPIYYLSKVAPTQTVPPKLSLPIRSVYQCLQGIYDLYGKTVCFTPVAKVASVYTPVRTTYSVYTAPSPVVAPIVETTPTTVLTTPSTMITAEVETPAPIVTTALPVVAPSVTATPAPFMPQAIVVTAAPATQEAPSATAPSTFDEVAELLDEPSPGAAPAAVPVAATRVTKIQVIGGILALVVVGGVVAYSMRKK